MDTKNTWDKNTEIVVFRQKIANALIKMGFEVVRTAENYHIPKSKVYYFQKTEEAEKALKAILQFIKN